MMRLIRVYHPAHFPRIYLPPVNPPYFPPDTAWNRHLSAWFPQDASLLYGFTQAVLINVPNSSQFLKEPVLLTDLMRCRDYQGAGQSCPGKS